MTSVLGFARPYVAACAAAAAIGWGFGALVGRWGALAAPVVVGVVLAIASDSIFGPPPSGDAAKLHGLGVAMFTALLLPASVGVIAGVWWRKARTIAAGERGRRPAPPRTVGWPRPEEGRRATQPERV